MIVVVEEDLLLRPSSYSTLERYADNVGDAASSSGIMRSRREIGEVLYTSSHPRVETRRLRLYSVVLPSFIKHKNSAGNKKTREGYKGQTLRSSKLLNCRSFLQVYR